MSIRTMTTGASVSSSLFTNPWTWNGSTPSWITPTHKNPLSWEARMISSLVCCALLILYSVCTCFYLSRVSSKENRKSPEPALKVSLDQPVKIAVEPTEAQCTGVTIEPKNETRLKDSKDQKHLIQKNSLELLVPLLPTDTTKVADMRKCPSNTSLDLDGYESRTPPSFVTTSPVKESSSSKPCTSGSLEVETNSDSDMEKIKQFGLKNKPNSLSKTKFVSCSKHTSASNKVKRSRSKPETVSKALFEYSSKHKPSGHKVAHKANGTIKQKPSSASK